MWTARWIEGGAAPQRTSVDLDPVARRIRGLAERGEPAVDPHAAVGDELLGTAARREPGARDDLLEPLTGHRRCSASAASWAASLESGGSSSVEVSPKRSRNVKVVPNSTGRPGVSRRPSSTTSRRWSSERMT